MKDLKCYILEAWGNNKREESYLKDIKELIEKTKTTGERYKAKREKNPYAYIPNDWKKTMAKYPMSILIDKMDYTPKEITKRCCGPNGKEKTTFDNVEYANWLWEKINANEISLEDMAKWYKEYDTEINRKQWFDINIVLKNLDYTKIWNIYYPKDDNVLTKLTKTPAAILYYLDSSKMNRWGLSKDELKMVENYYGDPTNQEMLIAAIKKASKSILKHRPTFDESSAKIIESILEDNTKVNGKHFNFNDYFEEKHNSKPSYYAGSNYKDEYGDAYYSLVISVINKLYGLNFYKSYNKSLETTVHTLSKKDSDEGLDKFIDEGMSLSIEIKDLGASENDGESGGVASSSFITTYRHDFNVIVELKGEEIYNETIKGVTVATDFYSGGWG